MVETIRITVNFVIRCYKYVACSCDLKEEGIYIFGMMKEMSMRYALVVVSIFETFIMLS